MMKNRIFQGLVIVFAVGLGLLGGLSCSDPDITMPERDNLLDEENPDSVENLFELQVIFDNTGVSLQWTAIELPEFAGYQVLRKTGTTGEFELQIQTENLYWFDDVVTEETEYTYQVVAVNADGETSDPLGEDSVVVPTLPIFQINNGSGYTNSEEVDLTLNAEDVLSVWVCNWTGADRDSLDGQWWVSKDKVDPLLSWELAESDVDGGKIIRIWIQYLNNATRTASGSIVLDKTPPAPGTLSTPEHQAQDVPFPTSMVWTAASDNGSGVAGYSLFLDTQTDPQVEVFTGNELTWMSGLLDPETIYYWRVSAFDTAGNTSTRYQDDVYSFITIPEGDCSPPVLTAIADTTIDEGSAFSTYNLDLFVEDLDTPDDAITWTYLDNEELLINISEARQLTVSIPDEDWFGEESIQFIATDDCDPVGIQRSFTTKFTVNNINDAPVLDVPTGTQLITENVEFIIAAQAFDPDPDQTLVFSIDQPSIDLGMAITEAGYFTWTPSEEQGPGNYAVEFSVTDGMASDSEIVSIDVAEANVAPVLVSIGTQDIQEMVLLSINVTASDGDFPIQVLSFNIDQESIDLGMTITEAGLFTWTPSEEQGPNTYIVEFSVTDGLASDSEMVEINVSESNVAPVLHPIGTQEVNELELLSFTVTAFDPEQTLVFSIDQESINQGMTISEAGLFNWTPSEEQGPFNYEVEFSVTDGMAIDSEIVTIIVTEANLAPVLHSIDNQYVTEMEPLNFTITASDDDFPEQTLVFSIDQASINQGMTISEAGYFNWTPTENHGPGEYEVNATVSDGLLFNEGSFTIIVYGTNYDGELVPIPPYSISMPATFTMGSTVEVYESPPHQVTLTGRFNMASTEVSNAQYIAALQWAYDQDPSLVTVTATGVIDAMAGSSESDLLQLNGERCRITFSGGVFSTDYPNRPVIQLTWYGSATYCDWLNLQADLPMAYDHYSWESNSGSPYTESGYRLPTEAEWEFACRAGSVTHFNTGDCLDSGTQANYYGFLPYDGCPDGLFLEDTVDVTSYPTNQWLLYNMHGNAFEWCNDREGLYSGDEVDPVGHVDAGNRMMRGGAYTNSATRCRSAFRNADYPGDSSYLYGFRFVRSVQ